MTVKPQESLSGKSAYLSGPCSGYQEYNKPLFELAEQKLAEAVVAAGYADGDPDEFSITVVHPHQEAVRDNLKAALDLSDVIVMLPGWARKGGTVEDLIYSIVNGKRVFYFDPATLVFTEMSPVETGTECTG